MPYGRYQAAPALCREKGKNMKGRSKWLCFALTVCMTGSLTAPAFAASDDAGVPEETVTAEQAEQETAEKEAPEEKGVPEGSAEEEAPDTENAGAEDEAEWTVMFYLCGTDLESDSGMASLNLEMISHTVPDSSVNMVIQTGGAYEWKSEEKVGIDIAAGRLQRWSYDENGFNLVDEQENASMARHDTLSDFISWCAENYPARKNMLILWDHGGGSSGGMIQDETYDYALMSLDGIEQALKDGGAHFDVVLMDACMMANLETAQMLQPYADYLLASEEIVPGMGSNYEEWLQDLYDEPECDPVRVGRNVCNSTQILYSEQDDSASRNGLTFSVIDLSRIGEVAEAFEAFMKEVVGLIEDPDAFGTYVDAVNDTDRYMERCLWDLYDLARRAMWGGISKETVLKLENAVDDAVIANIRGSYHPYSHGLSAYLCYNGDRGQLDRLARSDRNPWQLAFLDAVCHRWDAPSWVTDTVGKIPQIDPGVYEAKFDTELSEDLSQLLIRIYSGICTGSFLRYELQRYDEETGLWFRFGESEDVIPLMLDDGDYAYTANFTGMWPAIEGCYLSMESKGVKDNVALLQAPVVLPDFSGKDTMKLRIVAEYPEDLYDEFTEDSAEDTAEDTEEGFAEELEEAIAEAEAEDAGEETEEESDKEEGKSAVTYRIVGLWDGYDSSTGLPDRNTWSMAALKGNDIQICCPIYSDYLDDVGDMRYYDPVTAGTSLEVEDTPLPEGLYRMRYSLSDMLDKTYTSDFYNFSWDGENVVFADPEAENTAEDAEQAG